MNLVEGKVSNAEGFGALKRVFRIFAELSFSPADRAVVEAAAGFIAHPGKNEFGITPEANLYFSFPFTVKRIVVGNRGGALDDGSNIFIASTEVEMDGSGAALCNFPPGNAEMEALLPYLGRYGESTVENSAFCRVAFPQTGEGREIPRRQSISYNYYSMPHFILPGMNILWRLSSNGGDDWLYTRGYIWTYDESLIGTAGKDIYKSDAKSLLSHEDTHGGNRMVTFTLYGVEYDDAEGTKTLTFFSRPDGGTRSVTVPQAHRGMLLAIDADGDVASCQWSIGGDVYEAQEERTFRGGKRTVTVKHLSNYNMIAPASMRFRI